MKSYLPENLDLTAKVLDLQMQRQNLVSANLANIRTPQYRPQRIEFEKELQSALNTEGQGKMTLTSSRHMPTAFNASSFEGNMFGEVKPRVIYGQDSVDLDKEMALMSKNSLMYNTMTTIVKKDFDSISKVLADGGR
ncbi:MAG: flagellar basal body rod protein FlgB [Desulfovibrionaceae bacterium]|nr:flagellar basal body rod protein FlgB [Desulfovibrionaceae bacterium]MBF0513023.1 flagellar basal body rod protein FlgB [Desulfovibrionaceae bacterium]